MTREDCFVEVDCPAKLNLSLAILGKRDDGFHALHSVVAQTAFGDHLRLHWQPDGVPEADLVKVEGAVIPGKGNSVAHAIQLFRAASGLRKGAFQAVLKKAIPVGAGLGGGSSDAVAALKALRDLFKNEIADLDWAAIAAEVGSDCPLFLSDEPVIMEGRGERIRPVETSLSERVRGQPVVLFKPRFSINTAEAYRRLASGRLYTPLETAEVLFDEWTEGTAPLPPRLNDFERLVEDWLPSLAVVLDRLRAHHGLDARLSGSGSACFVFPGEGPFDMKLIEAEIKRAWGSNFWLVNTVFK